MTFTFDVTLSSAVSTDGTGPHPPPPDTGPVTGPLTDAQLHLMDRYWRAANYLTIGQIYLQANPLLTEPLTVEQIKPLLNSVKIGALRMVVTETNGTGDKFVRVEIR